MRSLILMMSNLKAKRKQPDNVKSKEQYWLENSKTHAILTAFGNYRREIWYKRLFRQFLR